MSQRPAHPPAAFSPEPEAAFDVVVLAGSAGGALAAAKTLRALLPDFALPIVVMLHLPPDADLVDYFARFPFVAGHAAWVTADTRLAPGQLLVCPPRAFVQLMPDGRCQLAPCERGSLDKPIDRLLQSVARSFGPRAIAVVLTGMGSDGALGARELHAAGGPVLVQSPATAEYADMPKAVVDAGAAHLVVPLDDLGQVVLELVAGTPRPKARSELQAIARAFGDRGEIAGLARQIDWGATVLGPVLMWPDELKTLVRATLDSPHASAVWWGPEFAQLYNDAWRAHLDVARHPAALGGPARQTWAHSWHDIEPALLSVLSRGEAVRSPEELVFIERHDLLEETYLAVTYAPLRNAAGEVAGVQHTVRDQTSAVLAERRMRALQVLAAHLAEAETPREVCTRAAAALAGFPGDLPFALFYLLDSHERHATLAAAAGLVAGSAAAPHVVYLAAIDPGGWPLLKAWFDAEAGDGPWWVEGLPARFPQLQAAAHAPQGSRVPERAVVLPLRLTAGQRPAGALVLALSPHQPHDAGYRGFVSFVAQQVNASLADARARELERERLDRLAALDRAKTDFFSNVSHEFRTPLTLLLAPLEELAREREALPPRIGTELDVAVRNARRLLRLVNSLLDFSQIEGRGRRALVAPTDLGALTEDIASAFRSAIEAAGLALRVDIPPDLPPVPVNPTMWEQIVSNLLSNALKFSFDGAITVRLKAMRLHVELEVSDTGIGISPEDLTHIFKRFHRVQGARARTAEGSGIGLAMVQDLVQRLGGQVSARSMAGKGSTFTIWLPLKMRPAAAEPPADEAPAAQPQLAAELAEEASRWTAGGQPPKGVIEDLLEAPGGSRDLPAQDRARLLVVDDNADLRDYLRRLLEHRWDVQLAADGAQALQLAREHRPDLILADVMMPRMDGFELLRAIRDDELLQHTPVVILTARAGEDMAVRGLLAGADDYVAKPFSARELIARVGGQIELARARRRTEALNAFLVRFSDAVRGVRDPVAVAETACRLVADHLQIERAYWGEIDWATREFVIDVAFARAGVPAITGRFGFDDWQPFTTYLLEGRPVVVDDTQSDPRVPPPMREGYAQIAVGADLAMPVLVNGRLVSLLAVNQRETRHWTAEELSLVAGVAGRCWAEVARARAELDLRESEARSRAVFETMIEACCIFDMLYDDLGKPVDWRILAANPGYERQSGLKDVAGKLASEFMPGTEAYWIETFARVAETGEPEQIEKWHQPTDRWIHSSTARVGGTGSRRLVSVFYDITERKRAEATLRESEERFRNVLNSMAEGFALLAPDFTLLDVNDETCRLDGRERHELVGRSHWEAFPGTEHSALGELYRRVMADRVARSLEHRYAWPDGRDMWVDMRAYPTPEGNLAVFWRDSTERKRAEQRLRDSELKYRTLFEAIDEGFVTADVIFDADGRAVDARYLEGNPAASRLTDGRRYDGRLFSELLPEAEAYWLEIYGEVARTGVPQRLERHLQPLERWYDFHISRVPHADADGRHRRVAVVFQDVTERRRAEDALRQREAELARVQRIGQVGGLDVDVAHGLTSRRSPEYLRLHGLPEDMGMETHQDWLDRIHPDDRERAEQTLFASLHGDASIYESEYRIVRPSDGEVRWIHVRADIERGADGRALRLVGAHLDVTERRLRDGAP